jgi:hypothetical protein
LHKLKLINPDLFAVGLSVAIIVPFLIVAFTVNPVRDRIKGTRRHIKYGTRDIESRLMKIGITIKWATYYLWAPVFAVRGFLWELTAALVEIAFEVRTCSTLRRRLGSRANPETTGGA